MWLNMDFSHTFSVKIIASILSILRNLDPDFSTQKIATAERVFSIVNAFFKEQQNCALVD